MSNHLITVVHDTLMSSNVQARGIVIAACSVLIIAYYNYYNKCPIPSLIAPFYFYCHCSWATHAPPLLVLAWSSWIPGMKADTTTTREWHAFPDSWILLLAKTSTHPHTENAVHTPELSYLHNNDSTTTRWLWMPRWLSDRTIFQQLQLLLGLYFLSKTLLRRELLPRE